MPDTDATASDHLLQAIDRKLEAALGQPDASLETLIDHQVEAGVSAVLGRHTEAAMADKLAALAPSRKPRRVEIHPSMLTDALRPRPEFLEAIASPQSELEALLDRPPQLSGRATRQHDGRRVPVALVLLRDAAGAARPGVDIHLRTRSGEPVDWSRTDRSGLVLLEPAR